MKYIMTSFIQATILSLSIIPTAYSSTVLTSENREAHTLNQMNVVSDTVLDDMRGRYVNGNTVTYFGIEMVSYWKTPDGALSSGIGFSADLKDQNNPDIQYRSYTQNAQNGPVSNNADQIITGTGLSNVDGVLQSVQSAGSNNVANNNLSVDIEGVNHPTPEFSSSFSNMPNQNLGNSSTTTSNGAISEANSNQSQLVTRLYIPGQGEVVQFLRHTNNVTGSGLGQQIALTSNNNQVQNSIHLNIQMDTGEALQHANDQTSQFLQKFGKL